MFNIATPFMLLIPVVSDTRADIVSNNNLCATQVCSFLSVWFVVAFTVERFIAVRYPLKRPSVCTASRAKMVLTVLTLFTLIICTPYLFISAPQWKPDPQSR